MCEIIGGVVGPVYVVIELLRVNFRPDAVVMGLVVSSFFTLSLYGGVMLWRDRASGYRVSFLVQLIQLPKLTLPQLSFAMSFGFDVFLVSVTRPNSWGIWFRGKVGEHHSFFVGPHPGGETTILGISIVSCVVLWLLLNHWGMRDLKHEPSADPIDEFKSMQEIMKRAKEKAN